MFGLYHRQCTVGYYPKDSDFPYNSIRFGRYTVDILVASVEFLPADTADCRQVGRGLYGISNLCRNRFVGYQRGVSNVNGTTARLIGSRAIIGKARYLPDMAKKGGKV